MVDVEMTAESHGVMGGPSRPGPCAVVIFGVTGDLAHRKLIPALYALDEQDLLPERFLLFGFGRKDVRVEAVAAEVLKRMEDSGTSVRPDVWDRFAARMRYVRGDYGDPESFRRLKAALDAGDAEAGTEGNRLFYLSIPPSVFPEVVRSMDAAGLVYERTSPKWSRVVIEKPFGRDLESARALNLLTRSILTEKQIYRIDHYLGKETVQNILVFRFANAFLEPVWNRHYVDHVEITFAESIGVENRGAFYEEAGVIRDIVQNHLLQVLALMAMEPPVHGDGDCIRDQKVNVFRALRPMDRFTARRDVAFGQYEGYRGEKDVDPNSNTPTFVALRTFVDNWRWQGVPFYLRAGKALESRVTEVAIRFQTIPVCVFSPDQCQQVKPNVLLLRIQPEEGIALRFGIKQPGEPPRIVPASLDFRYAQAFDAETPEAYERLLLDAMRGDQTLFTRSDEVEACWAWCDPIVNYLETEPPEDFPNYPPGTWGPQASMDLPMRYGKGWEV